MIKLINLIIRVITFIIGILTIGIGSILISIILWKAIYIDIMIEVLHTIIDGDTDNFNNINNK